MEKTFSHQEVCNILCEGCRLGIRLNTHLFDDKSYRLYHIIMDKDITCDADAWRRKSKMPPKCRRSDDIKTEYPQL